MIRSMTGYGKAERMLADKKLTIEIKSLNSKQLDTSTRLPSLYKEKELEIRQLIATELERGKVECSVYYELSGKNTPVIINEPVVKSYYEQLYRVSGELGLETSIELLSMIMKLPDSIKTERTELDAGEWESVKNTLKEALDKLNTFRDQEGDSLERDIRLRIDAIRQKLDHVDIHEKERMDQVRERIGRHLEEIEMKDKIDENRFEQELIYYIEKLDISEEKVRLANHCKYFLETMEDQGPTGKKLGFISQEMGREINTLGSKANHKELQKIVVEMKDELERIKEQVLNVL
jgi:uncharacterized protein (TIGR00255 family)